jgi:hypothetical protein
MFVGQTPEYFLAQIGEESSSSSFAPNIVRFSATCRYCMRDRARAPRPCMRDRALETHMHASFHARELFFEPPFLHALSAAARHLTSHTKKPTQLQWLKQQPVNGSWHRTRRVCQHRRRSSAVSLHSVPIAISRQQIHAWDLHPTVRAICVATTVVIKSASIYIYIYRKMRWYPWVYILPHSIYHIDESIIPIYNF